MNDERATISEKIALTAGRFSFDNLPSEARDHAKTLVLDLLGSMIGSRDIESSRIASEIAADLGGAPESEIIGRPGRFPALLASFANAIQSYAFDFADDHNDSNSHPSVATIPVSLAFSQKLGKSGRQVIEAIALGNELVCRLGASFLGKQYYQGFHPTSVCGTFGAALSAAKLLGLSENQTAAALGLAGSQTGGLMEWNADGSIAKRLQAGHPALSGALSALLAAKGFHGPRTIFEGESGFLRAYSLDRQYDQAMITEGFGTRWIFSTSSIKAYPCCRYSGGHLDACLKIASLYRPDPSKIAKVLIRSSDYTIRLLTLPLERKLNPQTTVDAQFSMPYQAAAALLDGKIDTATFNADSYKRPAALKLIPKVEWVVDEEFERRYPDQYSCSVEVIMKDGASYKVTVDNPRGDYRNPLDAPDVENKFRALVSPVCGSLEAVEPLIEAIGKLEEMDNMEELFGLVRALKL